MAEGVSVGKAELIGKKADCNRQGIVLKIKLSASFNLSAQGLFH